MHPKYRFVTFGDGSHTWKLAARRLADEARKSSFFEGVEVYNLRQLLAGNSAFPNLDFFQRTKGLGYWSWKSLVVQMALQTLPKNLDGVVYLDAGCTLNVNTVSRRRMSHYLQLASDRNGLAFQLSGIRENEWTKFDLGQELKAIDSAAWNSEQLAGGITFWKSGKPAKAIADQWVELSFKNGLRLIDDSPSSKPEIPEFIEHRHDQSIFSLLAKQSASFSVLKNETEWSPDWLRDGKDFPVWATRHRSGLSFQLNQKNKHRVWLRRAETATAFVCDIAAKIR